ncbi:MAG TPA: PfkB family carbohydrate kinase [Candidatus Saccharimonadales bacterium]|nr:PfkB family carbohydrate kinase [Candidatus Saccharimonadales bacterium]
MSHEKLVVGWVGAPLPDSHLNETAEPWPSHKTGDKILFDPAADGPYLDQLHSGQYVIHFGGNSHNAAVANASDSRFEVHELWAKGKSPEAEAIERDMVQRGIISHSVFSINHQNGGSFVKAMDGDRGIVTMPRTPLHETIKPQHVRDFLRIRGLGAVGISSLKSPELNAVMAKELSHVHAERRKLGLADLFTAHNPGSGEFKAGLLETWGTYRHSLVVGNRDEFNDLYGEDTAAVHAEHNLEYAGMSVVSDGIRPLQIAYAPNVLRDKPRGGAFEIPTLALDKSQVVDTTGAGDRLTSVFTSATFYAQQTGELTIKRLVQIAEFAAMEAGTVIQHLGGHGDKPYPKKSTLTLS